MGVIFSRPFHFIYGKFNDGKHAAVTRVKNTKNAICTKVTNAKNTVVDTVQGVTNKVYSTVGDVKNKIVQTIVGTKNCICGGIYSMVNGVRTAICTVCGGVKSVVCGTCNGIQSTVYGVCRGVKNFVSTKCTCIKNGVHKVTNVISSTANKTTTTVSDTCGSLRERINRVRSTRLTRLQKIKYSVLLFLFLLLGFVGGLIQWDVYRGNYDAAQNKVDTIWSLLEYSYDRMIWLSAHAYQLSLIGAKHAAIGLGLVAKYIKETAVITSVYLWDCLQIFLAVFYEYSCIVIEQIYIYLCVACVSLVDISVISFGFLKEMTVKLASISYDISTIAAHHTFEASKYAVAQSFQVFFFSVEKSIDGFCLLSTFTYAAILSTVHYGWLGLWHGSIAAYDGLIYITVNGSIALYYGIIYTLDVLQLTIIGLLTGSYTLSQLIVDASTFIGLHSYSLSIYLYHTTSNVIILLTDWTIVLSNGIYDFTCSSSFYIWSTLCNVSYSTFVWTIWSIETCTLATINTCVFIYEWTYTIITVGSQSLYVGLNQYCLHYAYVLGVYIVELCIKTAHILIKFFTDLVFFFWKFISVATYHIYTVSSIVFAFIYQIISAVMTIIKFWIDGMVFFVTVIFTSVIWLLDETLFAYQYAMQKYNRWRDVLFIGVCTLIVVYCGGVLKDRRDDELDGQDYETDDEEEEFIESEYSIIIVYCQMTKPR